MNSSPPPILRFHACGQWKRTQFSLKRIASTRPVMPEVEALVERAWQQVQKRPGVHLFDGAMCRLESWQITPERFHVVLSQTSYKQFVGTNLYNPELGDLFGPRVLSNPVGVSPSLLTADGFLMMGRRNESVAYYPERVHPFAGSLEVTDADPFEAILRELDEELSIKPQEVPAIHCTGLAEDLSIRQPELIFHVQTSLNRTQIEARLDDTEHHGIWSVPARPQDVAEALAANLNGTGEPFTPVAIAALLLYGRLAFGLEWFDQAKCGFVRMPQKK